MARRALVNFAPKSKNESPREGDRFLYRVRSSPWASLWEAFFRKSISSVEDHVALPNAKSVAIFASTRLRALPDRVTRTVSRGRGLFLISLEWRSRDVCHRINVLEVSVDSFSMLEMFATSLVGRSEEAENGAAGAAGTESVFRVKVETLDSFRVRPIFTSSSS
jgi:hypothetical protein